MSNRVSKEGARKKKVDDEYLSGLGRGWMVVKDGKAKEVNKESGERRTSASSSSGEAGKNINRREVKARKPSGEKTKGGDSGFLSGAGFGKGWWGSEKKEVKSAGSSGPRQAQEELPSTTTTTTSSSSTSTTVFSWANLSVGKISVDTAVAEDELELSSDSEIYGACSSCSEEEVKAVTSEDEDKGVPEEPFARLIIDSDTDIEMKYDYILMMVNLGMSKEALEKCKVLVTMDGVRAKDYDLLGRCYFEMEEYAPAERAYLKALRIGEEKADKEDIKEAKIGLALLWEACEQYDRALAVYGELLQGAKAEGRVCYLVGKGRALNGLNRFEDALKVARELKPLLPKADSNGRSAQAFEREYNKICMISLIQLKRYYEGLQYMDKLLEMGDKLAFIVYGGVLSRSGFSKEDKLKRIEAVSEKGKELWPDDEEVKEALGQYEKLKKRWSAGT